VALFEVGQIFRGDGPQDQFVAAAGLRRGTASPAGVGRHWSGSTAVDALDAKADAFAVLTAAGAPVQALQVAGSGEAKNFPAWLHPGRSGAIQIGPQNVLGYFGELHPRALEALKADGPLVAFEVILDRIPEAKQKPTRAKPALELSAFQPVSRDFAFIVDRDLPAEALLRAARGFDRKLAGDIRLFDVYEGKGLPEGKKSLAIAVTLQPQEATLTDAEIDAFSKRLVAAVEKATGGTLRG
jgi:phenylalanyl-tRNA synthetase beta chain